MANNNATNARVFAPEVDNMIFQAENSYDVLDDRAKALFHKFFQKMHLIAECGDDEYREVWVTAERGTIEDFGDYDTYLEEEIVSSCEEFVELWEYKYPSRLKWYLLAITLYNEHYAVYIDRKPVHVIQPNPERCFENDKTELIRWLMSSLDKALVLLKYGKYNEFVNNDLPFSKRKGKILRNDFWNIFPDEKEVYLADISSDEITRFIELITKQPADAPVSRFENMTASRFFDCCRMI